MANRLFPAAQQLADGDLPRLFRAEKPVEEVRVLFPSASQEMPQELESSSPQPEMEEEAAHLETPQEPEPLMVESPEQPETVVDELPVEAEQEEAQRQEMDALALAQREEQMREIVDILSRWKDHYIQQSRADSLEVAFRIAEKIIQRELDRDPALVNEFVDAAFQQAAESERVTLYIHPLDRQLLHPEGQAEPNIPGLPAHLRIEEDDTLSRGDCILESDLETIDGRMNVRLDALAGAARQALAPAPGGETS